MMTTVLTFLASRVGRWTLSVAAIAALIVGAWSWDQRRMTRAFLDGRQSAFLEAAATMTARRDTVRERIYTTDTLWRTAAPIVRYVLDTMFVAIPGPVRDSLPDAVQRALTQCERLAESCASQRAAFERERSAWAALDTASGVRYVARGDSLRDMERRTVSKTRAAVYGVTGAVLTGLVTWLVAR